MHGDKEDSFDEGDLIICDQINGLGKSFKVGDVVTFAQDISGEGIKSLVTHRIYKVNEDGTFQTKGDNNETYDQDQHNSIVFPDLNDFDILAQYHGTRIPKVGYVINFLQTPVGFFWCILFPMILFFLYQAVRVVMNAMAYSKEKGAEQARKAVENSGLTEEQKAQAIAEYLASQNAEKQGDAPKPEQTDEGKTSE
jgi:signal peptidase